MGNRDREKETTQKERETEKQREVCRQEVRMRKKTGQILRSKKRPKPKRNQGHHRWNAQNFLTPKKIFRSLEIHPKTFFCEKDLSVT